MNLHVGYVFCMFTALAQLLRYTWQMPDYLSEAESSRRMHDCACILMNSMTSLSGGEILVNGEAHTSQQDPHVFVSLRIRVLGGFSVAQIGAEEKMRHEEMD